MTVEPEANGVQSAFVARHFARSQTSLRTSPVRDSYPCKITLLNVGNLYEDDQASYIFGMLFVHNSLRRIWFESTTKMLKRCRNSLQTAVNPSESAERL